MLTVNQRGSKLRLEGNTRFHWIDAQLGKSLEMPGLDDKADKALILEEDLDCLGNQLFERHDRQQQRDHGDDRGGEEPHHIVG